MGSVRDQYIILQQVESNNVTYCGGRHKINGRFISASTQNSIWKARRADLIEPKLTVDSRTKTYSMRLTPAGKKKIKSGKVTYA